MGYTWPGDKVPGRHSITYQQHQANLKGQPSGRGTLGVGFGGKIPAWGQTAAGTAPAAPAPTAPASSLAPLPPDASYLAQMDALQRTLGTTQAGITGARTRGLQDYGFTEAPGGAPVFDPSNPFSKAALLKQNYTRSRAQTGQQMASGGQQYSGAYGSAQRYIGRQQLGAEDQLQRSLVEFLAQNTQSAQDAQTAYEQGAAQALAESTARGTDNPLYEPTPPAAAPAAATPAYRTQRGTSSTGKPGTWHIYPDGRKVFVAD